MITAWTRLLVSPGFLSLIEHTDTHLPCTPPWVGPPSRHSPGLGEAGRARRGGELVHGLGSCLVALLPECRLLGSPLNP